MNNAIKKQLCTALIAGLLGSSCTIAGIPAASVADASFKRISSFPIYRNLDPGQDEKEATAAEIIAVSTDGNTLIYTDSEQERIGFIDIHDAENPRPAGFVQLPGEPTSVAVKGNYALVVVNTSVDYINTSGELIVIDISNLANPAIDRIFSLGGQPDSIAVSANGRYAVIAIENERDEEACPDGNGGLIDSAHGNEEACEAAGSELGGLPQLPGGFLEVMRLWGAPSQWLLEHMEIAGISDLAPEDPEPEYVSINNNRDALITLQENNHILLVDPKKRRVKRAFSAGTVDLSGIDTKKDKRIEPRDSLSSVPREPDAISWINARYFATANEGDYHGGSRGFSLFDRKGNLVFDSGVSFEHLAIRIGHYPEKRSGKKGSEPEGVAFSRFGSDYNRFLFVGSERGNFVAVYRVGRKGKLDYVQALPAGVGPEGLLPMPARNLFIAAAEKDDAAEGFRSMITIYRLEQQQPAYPQIVSAGDPPIGWGALSGLAADRNNPQRLYTVHDSFYAQSRIYTLDVSNHPAIIEEELVLKRDGATVDYDLEGLATASEGGFWAVSEGKPGIFHNLLLRISADGTVVQEIELPPEIQASQQKFGFEGVAESATGKIYVAFQREWLDDPEGMTRIGEYDPQTAQWRFYHYPLDAAPEGGWVGLSELVALEDGGFAVIERDNQQGDKAMIKRIYRFDLPASQDPVEQYPVITKTLVRDMLPVMQSGNGWVPDKLEGLAVAADGKVYLVTDNDGLDDATGETMFLRLDSLTR
ncbi:esterase-like activity of phytase family protein [Thiolapillus sp.]